MNKILVTGGCGFIGSNVVERFAARGEHVVAFDNLSRRGAQLNAEWLKQRHGKNLEIVVGDVRDYDALAKATRDARIVFHLAAQVAVTTSVTDPRTDFEINALGTFNALEAARVCSQPPIFIFASTNKVYGGMEDVGIVEEATRYRYRDLATGIPETRGLDFHSPYGCSKGAADQYVRDYQRIYGIPTVVFRQSAIYGTRQFGVEDQGWVSWMIIAAVTGKQITIYGDGKQVRDLLWIDDLVDAYEAAVARIDHVTGEVYNMGGGAENILSVWSEFGPRLAKLHGAKIPVKYSDWRPGDQRVAVLDNARAKHELNWQPRVSLDQGLERLYRWVVENRKLFD